MDSNPHEIVAFYNLDGTDSYSHVFQVEASYPFFKGFTLTSAYRLTDAKTTYKGERMEKPLTSKYKGLLTASYQTPLGIWQFDATLQLNGGGGCLLLMNRETDSCLGNVVTAVLSS